MATVLQSEFIPENFSHIANKLLNYTVLMINGRPHRICEVEFYLNSPNHQDKYVHGHLDQTQKGTWYFHRFNNGTYKNGTFKGVDITFGCRDVCAAVLIRSIYDSVENRLIEGPCKTVDHILSLSAVDSIIAFTGNASLNVLNNERGLILVEGSNPNPNAILYGPRIGLSDKYPEYKDCKYRFVIGAVKKEKTKLIPLA